MKVPLCPSLHITYHVKHQSILTFLKLDRKTKAKEGEGSRQQWPDFKMEGVEILPEYSQGLQRKLIRDKGILMIVLGTVKRMADMGSNVSDMEKLNSNNYNTWSTRMRFYLLSQDLWSLGKGDETQPSIEGDLKQWKVRASKAMFVLSVTVEDDILQHIKEAKMPKEVWDTLTGLYTHAPTMSSSST
ncbi:Retrovirus-related Pol polyprotein from transposon TNT 1-94 [Senna tora]|uniref:Retrovirus-related Pol polyprotein from transposon TNT 1-94 n=1 Tax=Senna tora TaxID=362788 RepID=A0A834SYI4_9FABA|nr:Retrovirus-related Pol polyprotein from transposon TNT 1-94 [Senna tora]